MNIYVSHASSYDFKKELYEPIRNSELNSKHTFILPHEKSDQQYDILSMLKKKEVDLLIAEVSYPSTGQGIELGWAQLHNVPIVCIYKKGNKFSSALKVVADTFIEYESETDMRQKISDYINK